METQMWPNDIIINGKKLVGILTEMSTQIDYINHVTIGVGINVNLTEFPEEIRETATSLRLECGHVVKRAPLIAAVMKRFEQNYTVFLEHGDLSGLKERYSELLVNKDREVRILGAKEQYNAYALGINQTGELIVRKEDGTFSFSGGTGRSTEAWQRRAEKWKIMQMKHIFFGSPRISRQKSG